MQTQPEIDRILENYEDYLLDEYLRECEEDKCDCNGEDKCDCNGEDKCDCNGEDKCDCNGEDKCDC